MLDEVYVLRCFAHRRAYIVYEAWAFRLIVVEDMKFFRRAIRALRLTLTFSSPKPRLNCRLTPLLQGSWMFLRSFSRVTESVQRLKRSASMLHLPVSPEA